MLSVFLVVYNCYCVVADRGVFGVFSKHGQCDVQAMWSPGSLWVMFITNEKMCTV